MSCDQETVFIIDPDEAIREGLTALLGTLAIPVRCYPDAEAFLNSTVGQRRKGGCLVVEANLPGLCSLALLKKLRDEGCELPIVVLASTSNRDIAEQARRAGAADVIDKPLVNGLLLNRLQELLKPTPGIMAAAPRSFTLNNGDEVTIRAIRPDDADIEQAFVTRLSPRSRYMRFFSGIKQLSPYMLDRFTRPCYPDNWALIATISEAGKEKEIGVARYASAETESCAEFAIVVADDWHGLGVARRLLQELITVAENAGIERLEGFVLRENVEMLKFADKQGFTTEQNPDDATIVRVTRSLADSGYGELPATSIKMPV